MSVDSAVGSQHSSTDEDKSSEDNDEASQDSVSTDEVRAFRISLENKITVSKTDISGGI